MFGCQYVCLSVDCMYGCLSVCPSAECLGKVNCGSQPVDKCDEVPGM